MLSIEMPKEFTKKKPLLLLKKTSLSGHSIQGNYIKISRISID